MTLSMFDKGKPATGQKVMLATPVYGSPSALYSFAIARVRAAFAERGVNHAYLLLVGNCHCDDARNTIVKEFLQSDCTDLLFVDADVGFDVLDILRLLGHDADVVAGAYPKKQTPSDYPVRFLDGEIWSDANGLIEVEAVGTGFMRIRRAVLERMAFIAEQFTVTGDALERGPVPLIFERGIVNGARWSGDNNFCRKWRAQGGKVYVDPQCFLEHEGMKIWAGTLATHLRRKNGLALAGQIERIGKGIETDRDYIDLMLEWDNDPWNAGVELVKMCALAARKADGPILETGSGLTTLVMAAANPNNTVHCLEHSPVWAARVSEEARKLGLFNIVIHCAPLVHVNGHKWYDTTNLPHAEWSLVLNDGPPRQEGDRSVLWETIGPKLNGAMVLVDDVEDRAQLEPMKRWADATGRTVKIMGEIRQFAFVRHEKPHEEKH